MKRLIPLAAVLFLTVAASPVLALDKNDPSDRSDRGRHQAVVDDVIRMAQAGVSDDAIISYVVHTRDRFEVTADDVIAMNNAHVSNEVVKAVMDESAARDDRRNERRTERVYVAAPYYGWYDPFFYPYYDPFWYGPRVSIGVGFGFGRHFGGGFHHGHR